MDQVCTRTPEASAYGSRKGNSENALFSVGCRIAGAQRSAREAQERKQLGDVNTAWKTWASSHRNSYPVPGLVSTQVTEENARGFYRGWSRYMMDRNWPQIYAAEDRA